MFAWPASSASIAPIGELPGTVLTTVYCFHRSTEEGGTEWHCLYPATRDAIEKFGGSIIAETACDVDSAQLDANGRYFGRPNCDHFFHFTTVSDE